MLGGKGANQAVALAQLGGAVSLVVAARSDLAHHPFAPERCPAYR
jgi:sugar/nucleoside kinase (ribokinase family)